MNMLQAHSKIGNALHEALAKTPDAMLWLAIDGGEQPLADELAQALLPFEAEAITVPLRHPNVAAQWQPRWYPLNLARARDSEALRSSVAQAERERQPQSLQTGGGRRIAGWLQIDGPAGNAADHFGRSMIQTHPQGGRRLLRSHDPAVLWAWWPLLDIAQQQALLGPVHGYWLIDPQGQLVRLSVNAAEQPATQSLALSPQQWTELDLITPFNHALRRRLTLAGDTLVDLDTLHRDGMAALRRALALGFGDAQDLARFAEHALCVHARFDQHPTVKAALAQRGPDDYFGGLIAEISDRDWQQIREQTETY